MSTLGTGIHYLKDTNAFFIRARNHLTSFIYFKVEKHDVLKGFLIMMMIKNKSNRQIIKAITETFAVLLCKDLTRHFAHVIKQKV